MLSVPHCVCFVGDNVSTAKHPRPVTVPGLCPEGLLGSHCGGAGHCTRGQRAAGPPPVEQFVSVNERRYC